MDARYTPQHLQVLSDIDDTFTCSGGKNSVVGRVAGCDTRLPRHMIYPGVLAFYEALQRGKAPLPTWDQPYASAGATTIDRTSDGRVYKSADSVGTLIGDLSLYTHIGLHQLREVTLRPTPMAQRGAQCDLVFLSAYPHVYKDVSEQKKYAFFHDLCATGMLSRMPALVPGKMNRSGFSLILLVVTWLRREKRWSMAVFGASFALSLGFQWLGLHVGGMAPLTTLVSFALFVLAGAPAKYKRFSSKQIWLPVAHQKFKSIKEYGLLFPEYRLVFVGDSGQGDLRAAELAQCQTSSDGRLLKAAFIHRVCETAAMICARTVPDLSWEKFDPARVGAAVSAAEAERLEREWESQGIVLFETYAEAARKAFVLNLVSPEGLRTVSGRSRARGVLRRVGPITCMPSAGLGRDGPVPVSARILKSAVAPRRWSRKRGRN